MFVLLVTGDPYTSPLGDFFWVEINKNEERDKNSKSDFLLIQRSVGFLPILKIK